MSRRKDNKGRILRTGESQRKDLIYQYRYTDALGNRKCIYASDLKILREKEDELQRSLEDGLDYAGGEITVYELLQRYLSLKCGVRYPWQTFQLHLLHKGRVRLCDEHRTKRSIRGKKNPGYQGVGCSTLDDQAAKGRKGLQHPDQHPGRSKASFPDGL